MAIKGFTFKGVHSDAFFIVNRIKQDMLPDITHRNVSVPDRIGALDVGIDIGMRQFDVEVTLSEDSTESLFKKVEKLSGWLIDNELHEFIDDNNPDCTYMVRLVGTASLERIASYGEGTLSFVAPNPLAKGKYRELSFSGSTLKAHNYGNYKTGPEVVVNFTGNSSDFKILNTRTGDYVRVIHSFSAGDELVIDTNKAKISINGQPRMAQLDLMSDFFKLEIGENVLESDMTGVADVSVRYYDRLI
jgi:predicted phage tail component-like protein